MKKACYFSLLYLFLFFGKCLGQTGGNTPKEDRYSDLFKEFTLYMTGAVSNSESIADTVHLNYVLQHYLFANIKADSSERNSPSVAELSSDQLMSLKKELNAFYSFFQEHIQDGLITNLLLMPIRLDTDKTIYNNMTAFQKENTFILYNKRALDKPLDYILFIPSIKNVVASSRIWSWTLEFKFGKYFFKSVTGEDGYEYIFDAKK